MCFPGCSYTYWTEMYTHVSTPPFLRSKCLVRESPDIWRQLSWPSSYFAPLLKHQGCFLLFFRLHSLTHCSYFFFLEYAFISSVPSGLLHGLQDSFSVCFSSCNFPQSADWALPPLGFHFTSLHALRINC